MSMVIDASVAIKWFVVEDQSEQALELLEHDDRLLAPDFIVLEIANITWKKARRGEIEAAHALSIATAIRQGPLTFHASTELNDRALQIALELDHPIHDCLYLACAEYHQCPLITADRRLHARVQNTNLADLTRTLAAS
ncbi:MAG: type II toxin-antitoxin system VapC family toxin [Alphaproteobacteria bacterium]|jgi:predicted nucleic acid-binding protein|nr:type II toxin-antitoxin system VapC family toxin [Alphaproteobacteria bacterium]MDP6515672.1 type II toxin-antitoxin system VapC family toxin [Alphaproteobacteria bacterium]